MNPKTFVFSYTASDRDGKVLKQGRTKAKNMFTEFEAFAKFEDHLRKQFPTLHKLHTFNVTQESFDWFMNAFKGK